MYYNSIYSQLFNFISRYRFEKIVKKSGGDRYCKHFTAWKQFLTLLFAQISGKDSLREIENALLANHKRLYHLGMEAVAKSMLSEAGSLIAWSKNPWKAAELEFASSRGTFQPFTALKFLPDSSVFRCVLHRSSQNSLFGQGAGPFQEIILQLHREQHFTETHHKITENSLFFSILYFPTWTFTPPPRKMQFRDCYFCRNSLIMIINRKDYFFTTNAIDTLWTLSKFSPVFLFFWSKYATFRDSESKKTTGSLLPPTAATSIILCQTSSSDPPIMSAKTVSNFPSGCFCSNFR